MSQADAGNPPSPHKSREHRRRRFRRHRRRAFIRSVYSLPSLATLGNAICGFAAIYIAGLVPSRDPWSEWFAAPAHKFVISAYLIFLAMLFDGIDGRLARFTRHTTDFGGQLDSLADVVSFGVAPAMIALQLFKAEMGLDVSFTVSRLIWAIGALYMSCAAIRLARFNVSNEHGEQHHFSFLGLPSPGAAGVVAALILLQQDLKHEGHATLASISLIFLPVVVLIAGLLMVSTIRYPHVVNRYLRGRRSIPRLLVILGLVLAVVVNHVLTLAAGLLIYTFSALISWAIFRLRKSSAAPPAAH